jgi:hypothetical protein
LKRNYVVFDSNHLNILERNSQPIKWQKQLKNAQ